MVRLVPMVRFHIKTLALFLALWLPPLSLAAGNFFLSAEVDRNHLELGESLHLTLSFKVEGRMDFTPQLDPPLFPGFEPQGGPSQGQSITWVNGAMSMVQTITWELAAQKAGTVVLGPYRARGKDALLGEVVRETQPITVVITRPKGLGFQLPPPQASPPAPSQDDLRDIKADRPFPWALLAAGLVLAGGLLALLVGWWLKPAKPKVEAVPRDPGQLALEQLEKLRQAQQPGAELDFVRGAAAILRQYLRHRLDLRREATLAEAFHTLRFRLGGEQRQEQAAFRARLDWLLYSGVEVQPVDAADAYQGVRGLVIFLEQQCPAPLPPDLDPAPRTPARKKR